MKRYVWVLVIATLASCSRTDWFDESSEREILKIARWDIARTYPQWSEAWDTITLVDTRVLIWHLVAYYGKRDTSWHYDALSWYHVRLNARGGVDVWGLMHLQSEVPRGTGPLGNWRFSYGSDLSTLPRYHPMQVYDRPILAADVVEFLEEFRRRRGSAFDKPQPVPYAFRTTMLERASWRDVIEGDIPELKSERSD